MQQKQEAVWNYEHQCPEETRYRKRMIIFILIGRLLNISLEVKKNITNQLIFISEVRKKKGYL